MPAKINLHEWCIETHGEENNGRGEQQDYSTASGNIKAHLRDHATALCEYIREADVVMGCVAWLTNYQILDAMAEREVSIVVQKEDFLRPDSGDWSSKKTREKYKNLHFNVNRYDMPGIINSLNAGSAELDVEPVRCAGVVAEKNEKPPRCHHKFVVFFKYKTRVILTQVNTPQIDHEITLVGSNQLNIDMEQEEEHDHDELNQYESEFESQLEPYAVWTGSYNFTWNAEHSFENAVMIRDKKIAEAFANEYAQILALSEPLDWDCKFSYGTTFRIGT